MPNSSFKPELSAAFLTAVLTAVLSTLADPAGVAGQALLVDDINTAGIASAGYSSFDDDVAVANQRYFFSADDGITGREPWVLHLATGVAERLGDLSPGPTSSFPGQFVRIGLQVLFVATTPDSGTELWVSDGTPGGTVLVEDIAPGLASSSPASLYANGGGFAVFSANDGSLGAELWASDGTAGGTALVADINSGAPGSSPDQFAIAGTTLYFRATDGVDGSELWRWVPAGVSQVADIEPGAGSSSPSGLCAIGSSIVFAACTVADGCEPWRSDGTAAGTVQLADIHPTSSSTPSKFLWHPGLARTFFVADDGVHGRELWQGVAGVASRVTDLQPGLDDGRPAGLGALPTQLVFTGDDGGGGTRLYTYDGTTVNQIKSLSTAGVPSNPSHTQLWNGRIYFNESGHCWHSDGTTLGTIEWGTCQSAPAFVVGDGRLLHGASVAGAREIWSIDAADVETQETDFRSFSSIPTEFTWLGETVFFSADDGISGRELWVSDGTAAATELLDLSPGAGGSSPFQLTNFEDEIWFRATTPATGDEIWHSDGTAAGTSVYELDPGTASSYPTQLAVLGSSLFVVAYDDALGEQLFRIAGAATPAVVLDVDGEPDLAPEQLVVAGSRLYFFGESDDAGRELFGVDEDDIQPTAIEIVPGVGEPEVLDELVAWNGAVYFMADEGISGRQVWKSDGITVVRVSNLSGGYEPTDLTAGPGGVYFVYEEPVFGAELWRTDGVSTQRITDIDPLDGDANPTHLASAGGRLYFSASDGTNGDELWWTDGVQVGLVAELRPGSDSSAPADLVAAGSQLVFTADDGVAGRELWITNGSYVRRFPEVWPGIASSNPLSVAVDPAATRIYFSAQNATTWREPYRIDLQFFADGFASGNASAWSLTLP